MNTSSSPASSESSSNFYNEEMFLSVRKHNELDQFYTTYHVWTGVKTVIVMSLLFFLFLATVMIYRRQCKRKNRSSSKMENLHRRTYNYKDYWFPTTVDGYITQNGHRGGEPPKDLFCQLNAEKFYPNLLQSSAPIQHQIGVTHSFGNTFRATSLSESSAKYYQPKINSDPIDSISWKNNISLGDGMFRPVPSVILQSVASPDDAVSIGSPTVNLAADEVYVSHLDIPGSKRPSESTHQHGETDMSYKIAEESSQVVGINIIEATPTVSPCGSAHSITNLWDNTMLHVPKIRRSSSIRSYESKEFDEDSCSSGSDSIYGDESIYDNVSNNSVYRDRMGYLSDHDYLSSNKSAKYTEKNCDLLNRPATPCFPLCQSPLPDNTLNLVVSYSDSCKRLCPHLNVGCDEIKSCEMCSSTAALVNDNSMECLPIPTQFHLRNIRRCYSAFNSTIDGEKPDGKYRRTESDACAHMYREDSAESRSGRSSEDSTESDEVTESVSFHLMVSAMSADYPSMNTSRASSPSFSMSPPASPIDRSAGGISIAQRGCKGRLRLSGFDGRGVLKRQYSQFRPLSPHEGKISPFGLPTSLEEEGNVEDIYCNQNEQKVN